MLSYALLMKLIIVVAAVVLLVALLQGVMPVLAWYRKRSSDFGTPAKSWYSQYKSQIGIGLIVAVIGITLIIIRHWLVGTIWGVILLFFIGIGGLQLLLKKTHSYFEEEERQRTAVRRFLPMLAAYVFATWEVINWAKGYAFVHNYPEIPWIIGTSVMYILAQFAWWFIALPFGLRRAASYWPWATVCVTGIALVLVGFQHHARKDNVFGTGESIITYHGRIDPGAGMKGKGSEEHSFTFLIFDARNGGRPLWVESKNLKVSNYAYAAELGKSNPLPDALFDFGRSYWLETKVDTTIVLPRVLVDVNDNRFDWNAVTRTVCPRNDTFWHLREDGTLVNVVHFGKNMRSKPKCEYCGARMVPWTPGMALVQKIRITSPEFIPAEYGALADSLNGFTQPADSVGTDEEPDTTSSVVPQQSWTPPPPVTGYVVPRSRHHENRGYNLLRRLDGGAMALLFTFLGVVAAMSKLPSKGKTAIVLILAVLWIGMHFLDLWPNKLVGQAMVTTDQSYALARGGPDRFTASGPLLFASVGVAQGMLPFARIGDVPQAASWLSEASPVRVLVAILLLSLIIMLVRSGGSKRWFVIGLLLLPFLVKVFGTGHPWRDDGTTWMRYESFPLLVGALAIFVLIVGIAKIVHGTASPARIAGLIGGTTIVGLLLWMLLGIQPYGLAPNQHTEGLRYTETPSMLRMASAETLLVSLHITHDRGGADLKKGDRITIIDVDDCGVGTGLTAGKYSQEYRKQYGSDRVDLQHRRALPPKKFQDLWRVAYDDSTCIGWPVAMLKRDTKTKNPATQWVALYPGKTFEADVDGELVFGLNLREDILDLQRQSRGETLWRITYVVQRTVSSSSLSHNGLVR